MENHLCTKCFKKYTFKNLCKSCSFKYFMELNQERKSDYFRNVLE